MNQEIGEALLAALREGDDAYADTLAKYWSDDGVELWHEPGLPEDGPMTREPMVKARKFQGRAFKAAMPDFKQDNIVMRVVGDVIYLLSDQTGTLANGVKIRSPLATRLELKDGRIVKVALGIDLATLSPMREALAAMAGPAGPGEARNY